MPATARWKRSELALTACVASMMLFLGAPPAMSDPQALIVIRHMQHAAVIKLHLDVGMHQQKGCPKLLNFIPKKKVSGTSILKHSYIYLDDVNLKRAGLL